MKLKYYLRGLGIGIVVTAIIMSFTRQPEKLTDAQIKMRALELGMVEESVLADLQQEEELVSNEEVASEELNSLEEAVTEDESEEETENVIEEETVEEETAEEENTEETVQEENVQEESTVEEETTVVEESTTEENTVEEITTETIEENNVSDETVLVDNNEVVENYIIISVVSGNGSETVSRKLYEAGLVNSAVEYNRFLVKNGYDRRLKVGNHEIPVGATEEEMAKILCGIK